MTKPLESVTSSAPTANGARPSSWLKVGVFAAASALAGGMAAAWFYRKTLTRLRQAENEAPDWEFGIRDDDSDEQD
jgi:membrane associated rhomboid family serine protease